MWQLGPRLMHKVYVYSVKCSVCYSDLREKDKVSYAWRKGLKPASTPVFAEYSDMSTEAAMPKRQAGAMSERYFMIDFVTSW